MSLGFALLFMPAISHAVPLSTMFQGGTITAGGKMFTDWSLIELQTSGGGFADLDLIDVAPLVDVPFNTGIGYFATAGGIGAPSMHEGPATVQLSYSFNVRTIGGHPRITDSSVRISGYSFSARPAAGIRIIGHVENSAGIELGEPVALARPGDFPEEALFASAEFSPQGFLNVVTTINISAQLINDEVHLTAFEQRFLQIPEPSGAALAGAMLLGFPAGRIRRRPN